MDRPKPDNKTGLRTERKDATQTDPTGRKQILKIKDREIYFPYFVCFDATFIFEELIPVADDSEDKISKFLTLPIAERFFKLEYSSLFKQKLVSGPSKSAKSSSKPNLITQIRHFL